MTFWKRHKGEIAFVMIFVIICCASISWMLITAAEQEKQIQACVQTQAHDLKSKGYHLIQGNVTETDSSTTIKLQMDDFLQLARNQTIIYSPNNYYQFATFAPNHILYYATPCS